MDHTRCNDLSLRADGDTIQGDLPGEAADALSARERRRALLGSLGAASMALVAGLGLQPAAAKEKKGGKSSHKDKKQKPRWGQ